MIFILQKKEVYGCFANKYDPENPADIHVIKIHKYNKEFAKMADYIFLTKRDLRDIAASAIRRNLIENEMNSIFSYLDVAMQNEFNQWKSRARKQGMVVGYENMIIRKPRVIQSIIERLNQNVDPQEIHRAVESLEIKDEFDPITQLHPNHITDGRSGSYEEILDENVIEQINSRYTAWMKANKYLPESYGNK
jgi:hypothetical protein